MNKGRTAMHINALRKGGEGGIGCVREKLVALKRSEGGRSAGGIPTSVLCDGKAALESGAKIDTFMTSCGEL